MTVKEVVDLWKKDKILFVKESTFSAYASTIRLHVLPLYANLEIKDITSELMQELILKMVKDGLSKKSALDVSIIFKMIYKFAVKIGEADPRAFDLRFPKSNTIQQNREIEVYSEKEQKAIIAYIMENKTFRNIGLLICLCTGMRIGEICALQWRDIDIDKRCIYVNKTMQRLYSYEGYPHDGHLAGYIKRTKVIIDTAKTFDSNRIIPIVKDLYNILKIFKKIMNEDYYVITGTEKFSEPRSYRTYYYEFIYEKVGLDRSIKFHGLRHTFASRMIASGADIKTTSKILGHSKVQMTMDLYVHPTQENKIDAINKSMKNLFK